MDQGIMQPVGVKVTIRGRGELLLTLFKIRGHLSTLCGKVHRDGLVIGRATQGASTRMPLACTDAG